MAPTTVYIVILAVIGCCVAQERERKCKPDPKMFEYGQECIKQMKGIEEVDHRAYKELTPEEKRDMAYCIAEMEEIVDADHKKFNVDMAYKSVDNSPNTDEAKENIKGVIDKCIEDKDTDNDAEEILTCMWHGIKEYCGCKEM